MMSETVLKLSIKEKNKWEVRDEIRMAECWKLKLDSEYVRVHFIFIHFYIKSVKIPMQKL